MIVHDSPCQPDHDCKPFLDCFIGLVMNNTIIHVQNYFSATVLLLSIATSKPFWLVSIIPPTKQEKTVDLQYCNIVSFR